MSSFNIPLSSIEFPGKIHAVKPESSIRAAIYTMQKHGIGCVLVSNEKREILGIITERDILMKVCNQTTIDLDNNTVQEIMTAHPTTVSASDSLMTGVKTMMVGNFRHLVILEEDGSLKGVLSLRDILSKISNIIGSKKL